MLSPSEFNNAVPKFTNGNYANNPVDPQYIEEPTLQDYNRGVEPLETLPAQWWNWLCNQFTSRFNKINTYVKNIFDEITQLLSLLNISPDGTESAITTGQLKNFFKELYPTYVSDKLELGTTYVPQTRTVNGHELTGNITITKSDVGLGNVDNTSDVDKPVSTAQATAISTAIGALDVASVGGDDKYISAISETDGIISATAKSASIAVIAGDNAPVSGGAVAQALKDCPDITYYDTTQSLTLNCNDITDRVCLVTATMNNWADLNYPFGGLIFIITANNEVGDGFQKAISYGMNGTFPEYTRVCRNGEWQSWKKVLTADDVTNQVTNGDSAPVSSGAVADILSNLPTDAVLHYSFDDLPDYPDGTADVRLLDNNTYQIQSGIYKFLNSGGTVFSSEGGNLKAVISSGASWNGLRINYTSAKIIKIKIRVTELSGELRVMNGFSTGGIVLDYISDVGEYEYCAIFNMGVGNAAKGFGIILRSTTDSSTVVIEQIYIGDGSYSTPVIDNANGQNNATNNGGIAVQGVSGKGARFFANKISPMVANVSSIMGDVTISVWSINYGNREEYSLIASDEGENRNWRLNYNNKEGSIIIAMVGDTSIGPYNISKNTLHHFVLTINETSGKLYCDGILLGTVNNISNRLTANQLNIGGSALDAFFRLNGMIDDFLIFDRALTEKEVLALYYNKANTPKYYNLNNYKIDNANIAEEGGTGKYIESIKQEGGLIVPVEQTIDTAPVNASTKPITSGAMYKFLGGNTSAQSWLGKVFGWAMGRYWNTCLMGGGSLLVSLNRTVYTIYYANNLWVAGSDNGIIWSEDGEIWDLANGTAPYTFKHIYYANGMWVACSTGQSLWWSTDGKTWTKGDGVNTNYSFNHVYYAKKIWVACSESHGMYWSSNGKTWTQGTGSNTSYTFNDVYYGNNIWVAGSDSHSLWWSSDGKAWTQGTSSSTNYTFNSVRYADYIWVAGSDSHGLWWSSDGKAWNSSYIASTTVTINYIYYANGMWQACGEDKMFYSSDGKNFKPEYNPFLANCRSVYYANGTWVAGTDKGLIWSINGKNWQLGKGDERDNYSQCQFLCVYFAKNYWLAGGIYDGAHFVQGFWYSDFDLVELKD